MNISLRYPTMLTGIAEVIKGTQDMVAANPEDLEDIMDHPRQQALGRAELINCMRGYKKIGGEKFFSLDKESTAFKGHILSHVIEAVQFDFKEKVKSGHLLQIAVPDSIRKIEYQWVPKKDVT